MRTRLIVSIIAAACISACTSLPARADLTGSQVSAIGAYPDESTVYASAGPVTVGPAIEFPLGSLAGYSEQIDVTGNQIIITTIGFTGLYTPSAFDGFILNFTGAPAITSVTLDSASNLDPIGFTFTSDQLAVNLEGLPVSDGSTTIFDINTSPAATPEPSGFLLMGTGLVGVAGAARRRWMRV